MIEWCNAETMFNYFFISVRLFIFNALRKCTVSTISVQISNFLRMFFYLISSLLIDKRSPLNANRLNSCSLSMFKYFSDLLSIVNFQLSFKKWKKKIFYLLSLPSVYPCQTCCEYFIPFRLVFFFILCSHKHSHTCLDRQNFLFLLFRAIRL